MVTIKAALQEAVLRLGGSPGARLDAEVILVSVSGVGDRTFLFSHPEQEVTAKQLQEFEAKLSRRERGEPVAYITGTREFWSLELQVTDATLIPRPETELVVETVLEHFGGEQSLGVLDLGTGAGAISLALASEEPGWKMVALDKSVEALEVARANARRLGIDNITWLESDWYSSVTERFEVIVSNPPYVEEGDPLLEQGDVRFEPRSALASGVDGLLDIRKVVQGAGEYLESGGLLVVEHGFNQGDGVRVLFEAAGFCNVQTRKDLAGKDRVTLGVFA
jgi:release factor glutamine methyltransferase